MRFPYDRRLSKVAVAEPGMNVTEEQRQSVRDLVVAVFQANGGIKANGDRLVAPFRRRR